MSRIGKLPIEIPEGVKAKLSGRLLTVSGPKGELDLKLPRGVEVDIGDNLIKVVAKSSDRKVKALHGTVRALIANNVIGVTRGWEKKLELVGTGYRAEKKGDELVLSVGFSHPVRIKQPEGIEFRVQKTQIEVSGLDKELVGKVAAKIRAIKPPEPYKGKGIRYQDEVVRKKPGKAAKAQGALAQ